ncbi:MAG: signal peptidase II [Lachnospira sp.]|nr:signal peptidase II [Lachnospira sp.]
MSSKKSLYNWKALIVLLVSAVILVAIDQVTKIISVNSLKDKAPFVIIEGVFEFYYLENTGTAWGLFAGARYIFLILTVIILAVIVYIVLKMPYNKKYMPLHIVIILIASGAVGNFIDRLCLGYVRDFIYFKLIDFPIFNVADIYVTVSMFAMAFLILFKYDEEDFGFLRIVKKDE